MTEPQPPPLQADSPTALFDGRVVERYRPPGVGGGDFAVDLANAPRAIRELEEAARELVDHTTCAVALGRVTPPSRDQVSLDAATMLGISAVGGNGSLPPGTGPGHPADQRHDRGPAGRRWPRVPDAPTRRPRPRWDRRETAAPRRRSCTRSWSAAAGPCPPPHRSRRPRRRARPVAGSLDATRDVCGPVRGALTGDTLRALGARATRAPRPASPPACTPASGRTTGSPETAVSLAVYADPGLPRRHLPHAWHLPALRATDGRRAARRRAAVARLGALLVHGHHRHRRRTGRRRLLPAEFGGRAARRPLRERRAGRRGRRRATCPRPPK